MDARHRRFYTTALALDRPPRWPFCPRATAPTGSSTRATWARLPVMISLAKLDFPHFSSAWPSGHSPKDILVSDEAQGVIDRQDGAAERACRSRSALPEPPIEYLESSDPVGRKRASNAPGWVRE